MINNCELCDHRHTKGPNDFPNQHCYMFMTEPEFTCAQNTTNRADIRISSMVAQLIASKKRKTTKEEPKC